MKSETKDKTKVKTKTEAKVKTKTETKVKTKTKTKKNDAKVKEIELMEQRKFDRATKSNAIIYTTLYFDAQSRNLHLTEQKGKYIKKRMREEKHRKQE